MTRARMAVLAYFVILGLTEGLWVARIPLVKERLHLSDGLLGVSMLVGPAGLVLVMPLAGRLVDRFGSARLTRPAGLAVAVLSVPLCTAQTLPQVMTALLVFGVAGGMLGVAVNAEGVRVQRGYGQPLMASFFASYSVGGLTGALLGGLMAWRRAELVSVLAATVLACMTAAIMAGHWLLPEPAGPQPGRPPLASRRVPGSASPRLLVLGLLALCCVITEGAVGSWSGVYLREVVHTSRGLAAAGFAAFSMAMAGGRLVGDRLAVRYGPAGLVRRCALLAAVGLASALCIRQAAVAVAGFAACGIGLSCTIPQVFSEAGNTDPGHPGRAVGLVGSLAYLGLVGGPVLIGGCASLTGLTGALCIPVGLGLCVTGFAFLMDRPVAGERVVSEPVVSGTGPGRSAGSRSR